MARLLLTRRIARSLGDSWASCFIIRWTATAQHNYSNFPSNHPGLEHWQLTHYCFILQTHLDDRHCQYCYPLTFLFSRFWNYGLLNRAIVIRVKSHNQRKMKMMTNYEQYWQCRCWKSRQTGQFRRPTLSAVEKRQYRQSMSVVDVGPCVSAVTKSTPVKLYSQHMNWTEL